REMSNKRNSPTGALKGAKNSRKTTRRARSPSFKEIGAGSNPCTLKTKTPTPASFRPCYGTSPLKCSLKFAGFGTPRIRRVSNTYSVLHKGGHN
ncbi:hypothetical protein PFISCL1PPCAC_6917, partial [Pristionchus fissidentatus]